MDSLQINISVLLRICSKYWNGLRKALILIFILSKEKEGTERKVSQILQLWGSTRTANRLPGLKVHGDCWGASEPGEDWGAPPPPTEGMLQGLSQCSS